MRGETTAGKGSNKQTSISIHSPHARGDALGTTRVLDPDISIHSPHARGDTFGTVRNILNNKFQSTPLMRGET